MADHSDRTQTPGPVIAMLLVVCFVLGVIAGDSRRPVPVEITTRTAVVSGGMYINAAGCLVLDDGYRRYVVDDWTVIRSKAGDDDASR
jgi:hypothetical protein